MLRLIATLRFATETLLEKSGQIKSHEPGARVEAASLCHLYAAFRRGERGRTNARPRTIIIPAETRYEIVHRGRSATAVPADRQLGRLLRTLVLIEPLGIDVDQQVH